MNFINKIKLFFDYTLEWQIKKHNLKINYNKNDLQKIKKIRTDFHNELKLENNIIDLIESFNDYNDIVKLIFKTTFKKLPKSYEKKLNLQYDWINDTNNELLTLQIHDFKIVINNSLKFIIDDNSDIKEKYHYANFYRDFIILKQDKIIYHVNVCQDNNTVFSTILWVNLISFKPNLWFEYIIDLLKKYSKKLKNIQNKEEKELISKINNKNEIEKTETIKKNFLD